MLQSRRSTIRKLICSSRYCTFSVATHRQLGWHVTNLAPLGPLGHGDCAAFVCMHPKKGPLPSPWYSHAHAHAHAHSYLQMLHQYNDSAPAPCLIKLPNHPISAQYGALHARRKPRHPRLLTPFHTHLQAQCMNENDSPGPTHPVHARVSDIERKRLLKLVDEEDLKKRLLSTGQDSIPYADFLKHCKDIGIATTDAETDAVVKHLDDAGVILVFRNVIFLHPRKVAEMIATALPLSFTGDDDPRKEELQKLERAKEDIDKAAEKQVRRMLWVAFGALSLQSLLFFRLTFWDLSWDVMEPITFFVTSATVLAGLLFFIFTRREPSYQDLMQTLFSIKQRKLMKKSKFDDHRFKHLRMMQQCASCSTLRHSTPSLQSIS